VKKDLRTLSEKAQDYSDDLYDELEKLKNGEKVSRKYSDWNLTDCYDMFSFYDQIQIGHYKRAYNKLTDLWKERGLVPHDIQDELFNMFSDDNSPKLI